MSTEHPIRQAAEADFLDALEHLSGTFADLDEVEGEGKTHESPEGAVESVESTDGATGATAEPMVLPKPAIAEEPEGYDSQAVRSHPQRGNQGSKG